MTMAQRVAMHRIDRSEERESRRAKVSSPPQKLTQGLFVPENLQPTAEKEVQEAAQKRAQIKAADTVSAREARKKQESEREAERKKHAEEAAVALRERQAVLAAEIKAAKEAAKAEAEAEAAQTLTAVDGDGDGKLDLSEFIALARAPPQPGESPLVEALHSLTDEELKQRFEKADADGSGQIDMEEYVSYAQADAKAQAVQRMFGKAGMGGATLEEALEAEEVATQGLKTRKRPRTPCGHRSAPCSLLAAALRSDLCTVFEPPCVGKLHWSGKGLDSEDAAVVAYIVACSNKLISLDISANDLGDAGADAIGAALKVTRAPLATITLSGNKVSDDAVRALVHVKSQDARWAALHVVSGQEEIELR